jgi:FixJ family two-component response regulator
MNVATTPLVHIVDDDASLRTAVSRLLVASGYRVATHESAAQFLEQAHSDDPGCILLDVNMPGLSGLQLQEQLVKAHIGLPIIFLTGHGDIAMSVRAIKSGAEDFLTKPVEKADLLEAIQRALRRYDETRSKQAQLSALRSRFDLLTPREKEVFNLIVQGMLNKQVAYALGNTERTVKAHRHSIVEKMQVNSLAELVTIATQIGVATAKSN